MPGASKRQPILTPAIGLSGVARHLVKDSAALRFDLQQQRFTNQYGLLFSMPRFTESARTDFFPGDDVLSARCNSGT
jgi:hypothetical protein